MSIPKGDYCLYFIEGGFGYYVCEFLEIAYKKEVCSEYKNKKGDSVKISRHKKCAACRKENP